jgi:hypothetical protein
VIVVGSQRETPLRKVLEKEKSDRVEGEYQVLCHALVANVSVYRFCAYSDALDGTDYSTHRACLCV